MEMREVKNMKVKYVEDPELNKEVAEIVEELKKELISYFRPATIILTGSFGRGEASVIKEYGKLKFLSDCEIIIIPNWNIRRKKIEVFSKNFYEETGLKVDISGVILSFQLLLPFLVRSIKPTINNYELKYGSKVIYGKNFLKKIPHFKSEDIPLWEGIRLLLNRMIEGLEYFSIENPSREMVYWTDKIVLACQDALLLSLGIYHYSYKERNKIFCQLPRDRLSDFEEKYQKLLEFAKNATKRKLNSQFDVESPHDYWFDVMEICDEVFRYVTKKEMQIEFKDYIEFQRKYLSHPNLKNYSRLPFHNTFGQNLWSALRIFLVYREMLPKRLLPYLTISWAHAIYSAIPLVYFGLSRDGKVNKKYLCAARKVVSLFRKESLTCNESLECWKNITKQIINYWRRFCW